MTTSLLAAFTTSGFVTAVNTPFAGALVPAKHYHRDARVKAVMVEVRRDLYLDEATGELNSNAVAVAHKLRSALLHCASYKT